MASGMMDYLARNMRFLIRGLILLGCLLGAAALAMGRPPGMRTAVFAGLSVVAAMAFSLLAWSVTDDARRLRWWDIAAVLTFVSFAAAIIADDERLIETLVLGR